jgi:tetratricopeptide (TPR) repeat protein/TolB-like protein
VNSPRPETANSVFIRAAELPKSEQAAFLKKICAGDEDLAAKVERLLKNNEETQTLAIRERLTLQTIETGEVLGGRFRIVRFVGRGGMGEVYAAEDRDLRGTVALKIIRPELSHDPTFLERFRREVQIARQVTHANVCRVYDVGYDRQGNVERVFLTMEFLRGETLEQRLGRVGRLGTQAALPLIQHMAAGLSALHDKGIVHRDFKPGNVLIVHAADGAERAVISDFGLARAVAPTTGITMTRGEHAMGTPDYMAPEQLLGQPATPLSDIYALGLVMYKMATGKKPFPGAQPMENAVRRVVEQPSPPSEQSAGISPQWNDTILRCLARRPEDRPQSAAEVAASLSDPRPPRRKRYWARRNWMLAGALAVLLAGIPIGMRIAGLREAHDGLSSQTQHLAVLPLKVLGDDAALRVFAQGLAETITSRMSQFENRKAPLLVVPASEVRSQGATTAGEARQKFGVGEAVEGTLESEGDRLRLLLTLIDTATMRQVETIELHDQRGNSWRLQDSAVTRLANTLNVRLQPKYAREQQEMNQIAPGAYEYYLQARGYLQRNDQVQSRASAIALLNRAIELDPKFAVAHSALGQAYLYQFLEGHDPNMMDAALESGNRGVRLNADLPETNIALGLILYGTGRYEEARQRFEKAIDLDTRNHEAYQGLAKAYLGLKSYADAEATYRKAISLRPDDWTGYKALALYYYEREDYTKAAEQFQKVVDLTPDNAQGYLNLGAAYAGRDDWDAAEKAWLRALDLDSKNQAALSNLGKLYLDERRQTPQAIEMYRRALAVNNRSFRAWGQLGRAYARSGDREKANEAFAKAMTLIDAELLINSKSVMLYSSLGFYRALAGRKDFAEPVERALALAPGNREPLLRAAEAYSIAGNRRRATELLDKALTLGTTMKSVRRSEYLKDVTPIAKESKLIH